MTKRYRVVALSLIAAAFFPGGDGIALAQAPVKDEPIGAVIRLRNFFDRPTQNNFNRARVDARERAPKDPEIRTQLAAMLQNQFDQQWISGQKQSGPSLQQFQALADLIPPFGQANRDLVAALTRTGAPVRWKDPAFREYVRTLLQEKVDNASTADLLLAQWPAAPTDTIARFLFLNEVLPATQGGRIRSELSRQRLALATPENMAEYSAALREAPANLTRFAAGDAVKIRGELGIRLFALSPATWAKAGKEIGPLVHDSGLPPIGFLGKAADHFRRNPTDRTPAAVVLAALAALIEDSQTVFRQLTPDYSAEWFAWLHTADVFKGIHAREDLLRRSYDILKAFAARDFATLFPSTVLYYYNKDALRETAFRELIRPEATRANGAQVLTQALQLKDGYRTDHREILARDVLASGDPLSPAWPRGPARLDFAIRIYAMPDPGRRPVSAMNTHLASPLLDDVVSGILALMRRPQPPVDETVKLMEPLATHLEQVRVEDGDTSASPPLLRLDDEISADMSRAVDVLAAAGTVPPAAVMSRFVEQLRIALRIRTLVERAIGRPPSWMTMVRSALRRRIFGLPESSNNKTLYWSESLTRARASFLVRLDEPLRKVLLESRAEDESRLFFRELYLPLARVRGFLRVLQEQNPSAYPHRVWIEGAAALERKARLEEMFAALETDRWLDADNTVFDLATLDLQQRANPWTLAPESLFAKHWSVNANLRIFQRLLAASPPPPGANWELGRIAARVVDELEVGGPPNGPAFPAPPGGTDGREDVWSYANWAGNLVTAAERQLYPLRGPNGGALPWQQSILPSNFKSIPFEFVAPQGKLSRRVDGRLRLKFARLLAPRVGGNAAELELVQLADAVLLLPNHPENDSAAVNDSARRIRQEIYGRLNDTLSNASDRTGRKEILRRMMRLSVAQRSGSLNPPFDQVLGNFIQGGQRAIEDAKDVQSERVELIEILNGKPPDNLETARAFIDGQVAVLLPPGWTESNANTIAAQFGELLDRMTEERVRAFFQLGQRLNTVSGALAHETRDRANYLADLRRMEQVLELVNSHVWFTRPDLRRALEKTELYFRPPKFTPDSPTKPENWFPALVVMAWYDQTWQHDTFAALSAYTGPADEELDQIRGSLLRQSLQLNEAVFATVKTLALRADADAILKSHRTISWSVLDLRILVETVNQRDADPRQLPDRGFKSLLANLDLAARGRRPNDDELWQRLFGSLDYLLPERYRRNGSLSVNLDEAVRLSEEWAHSEKLHLLIREAAKVFAAGNDQRSQSLMEGAATPGGVMRVFHEILRRTSAAEQPWYLSFYTNALTTGQRSFSPYFQKALAGPFFGSGLQGQRETVDGLLAGWKQHVRSSPKNSVLETIYRSDFDRVLASLIRGKDRPAGASYIWEPVDVLRKEQGLRPTKPTEFFVVAQWLLALQKRYPEPELRSLFAEGGH